MTLSDGQTSLRRDLRDFAAARPSGWSHDDWLNFVEYLRERGHDTSDTDAIGMQLERERLAATLEKIPGVGPKRVDALVERFENLWEMRQATAEQISEVPNIPRSLAQRVYDELH